MESIERLGLLQPITITPDGVLVCGWRRLEAVRRLGWRTMKVWVRSGISDKLSLLLAQQDENQLHKPLNELEKAALYRELKALRAEEAERRMQATQFGRHAARGGASGSGAEPGSRGDARVASGDGDHRQGVVQHHERVNWIESVAMDWASRPGRREIRAMANDALSEIEQGEPVKPLYLKVKEAFERPTAAAASRRIETDLARLAREARERAEREEREKGRKNLKRNQGTEQPLPERPLVQPDLDRARRLDRAVRRRRPRRPAQPQRLGTVRPRRHRHDRVPRPTRCRPTSRGDIGVAGAPIGRP